MVRKMRVALACALLASVTGLAYSGTLVVKQDGSGDHTTIQAALDAALPGDIISVEDNNTYTENLTFTTSSLTLVHPVGATPSIELTATPPGGRNCYISMTSDLSTIDGFPITFTGTPVDNVFMVLGGSNSTLRNCKLTGSATGLLRGVGNVPTMDHVEISNVYQGIIVDAPGMVGQITDCYIHDNTGHNSFSQGTWSVVRTTFERCQRSVYTSSISDATVTLTSCTLSSSTDREIIRVARQAPHVPGLMTLNYCTLQSSVSDLTLFHDGTTDLNHCLLLNPPLGKRCILIDGVSTNAVVNLDHCTIVTAPDTWAIIDNSGLGDNFITVRNSIITGFQGMYDGTGNGWITEDFNNIFVADAAYSQILAPGTHDIQVDPQYLQTTNPAGADYFVVGAYSPAAYGDEFGGAMGARGAASLAPETAARTWEMYQ